METVDPPTWRAILVGIPEPGIQATARMSTFAFAETHVLVRFCGGCVVFGGHVPGLIWALSGLLGYLKCATWRCWMLIVHKMREIGANPRNLWMISHFFAPTHVLVAAQDARSLPYSSPCRPLVPRTSRYNPPTMIAAGSR